MAQLVVLLVAGGGCLQNDLSPSGAHQPLGEVAVRGGGSVEVTVTGNRSGGHCIHWLGGASCSIDVIGARQDPGAWPYVGITADGTEVAGGT